MTDVNSLFCGSPVSKEPWKPPTSFQPSLFDLGQLAANLLVGSAFGVVGLNKFPAHHALGIDHKCRGMRPALAVGIEDTVTVDHLVVFIFEQRKIEFPFKAVTHHLGKLFGFRVSVDADGEDLHFLLFRFGQKALQLPELTDAERSPIAAIKYQHDGFIVAKVR